MNPDVKKFYDEIIQERTIDNATDFSSFGQTQRFKVIARELAQPEEFRRPLLDYGCNVGGLYDYMSQWHGMDDGLYTGVDAHPAFTERLRAKGRKKVYTGDICDNAFFDKIKDRKFDHVVCSGVFCHCEVPFDLTVDRLWSLTKRILIFNLLTVKVDKPGFRYFDSEEAVHAAEIRSNYYSVIRNYLDNDMTVVLYRNPQR